MINQAAKRILKALSFDGVEVDAFRHMADLKRLDPMKIFYKKIDEKIYNGSHAVPVRIFFPNEKSFQESNDKTSDSRDKKLLLFVHGGGWVTESIDNYERICARLADATGQYVAAVEYRLAPEHCIQCFRNHINFHPVWRTVMWLRKHCIQGNLC